MRLRTMIVVLLGLLCAACRQEVPPAVSLDVKTTEVYGRLKAFIDDVPAISSHDHLHLRHQMMAMDPTPAGKGVTLHSLWAGSYAIYLLYLTPWPGNQSFDSWWTYARPQLDRIRATGFYRYMLPSFRDLYGVEFEGISDVQAHDLNSRIFANYQSDDWIKDVVTRRANIELVIVDPFWSRIRPPQHYRFCVPLLNVTSMILASHPKRVPKPENSPYAFAEENGLEIETFDDYLSVMDAIFGNAVQKGAVGTKSAQAYIRGLDFENVSRERAMVAFRRDPDEVTPEQAKDFQDFMMWRMCELSAKHGLPMQIHTGQGRPEGSNPMLLANLIKGNPKTKFALLHGGFPWVGETALLGQVYPNVWIDCAWLPTISSTMAKRAFHEWLEIVPADRIMWGTDSVHAEGIYGATVVMRRCLAEALAEKVVRGELPEAEAMKISRMILRENAIALYPRIKTRLIEKR